MIRSPLRARCNLVFWGKKLKKYPELELELGDNHHHLGDAGSEEEGTVLGTVSRMRIVLPIHLKGTVDISGSCHGIDCSLLFPIVPQPLCHLCSVVPPPMNDQCCTAQLPLLVEPHPTYGFSGVTITIQCFILPSPSNAS